MELKTAIEVFGSLAQGTRLDTFRLLVRHEPDGMAAGDISRELVILPNTMSAHLAVLSRAGLVTSQRHGKSIVYRANFDVLRSLTVFLVKDCCEGRHELCEPLLTELACS